MAVASSFIHRVAVLSHFADSILDRDQYTLCLCRLLSSGLYLRNRLFQHRTVSGQTSRTLQTRMDWPGSLRPSVCFLQRLWFLPVGTPNYES